MKNISTALIVLFSIIIPSFVTAGLKAEDITLIAPDGKTVEIHRDSYGVPHIKSGTEIGVFFGQGFAAAQDRLRQMVDFKRAALGKTAELLGPSNLDFDKYIRTYYYTGEERQRQFDELTKDLQDALESYVAGVNTYLDSMAINPQKYKPVDFLILPYSRWKVTDCMAIAPMLIRNFGWAGGSELQRLTELQENGQEWFDENRPINYAGAPTTIPDSETGNAAVRTWKYSGMKIRNNVVQTHLKKRRAIQQQADKLGIPGKFGSFATLITPTKSETGDVMLLGCPQMGTPQIYKTSIVNEVELICPTYHVSGMIIAGMPGVIIGRNEYFAWTLTSGMSDNSDVYIETTFDTTFSKYKYNSGWRDFEVFQDTISVFGQLEIFKHYRTIHGPVFEADLANKQVYSEKMTFWDDEFGMMKAIFGMGRAQNLEEFEAAASLNPMSFNLFYAGKDQNVKFWHVGRYQNRSDGVDPRLPHNGDGSEEWGGFIDFSELPSLQNPAQGYLVNWNNKPVSWWNNGDNVPWRAHADTLSSATFRVMAMENYVGPLNNFTFENLKNIPWQIQSHGTYQQAISLSTTDVTGNNILPPGQSAFVNLLAEASLNNNDQWDMHVNWQFKEMVFGENVTTDIQYIAEFPETFELFQNYPNPFNPETQIVFKLQKKSEISLRIYNIQGKLVRTLVTGKYNAGSFKVSWNGKSDQGQGVSSGIYIYKLEVESFVQSKRMIFIK